MSKVYCSAPWTGMTLFQDGCVKVCCAGRTVLADLNQDPIARLDDSPILTALRDKMATGQPDEENCKLCIDQEKTSGVAPLRQHFLKYHPIEDLSKPVISMVDLRWNNSCNLGCVYCSPIFSSVWADRLLGSRTMRMTKSYHDDLLVWILDHAEEITELTLIGGEPMLQKQNYQLLKSLPRETKISIITNLSYDLEQIPCMENLLGRPKGSVLWNVSAENIGDKFEYIRNGADWKIFEKNLNFLAQHFDEQQTVMMTYCLLSAFDLSDTIKEFFRCGVKKFLLQPLIRNTGIDMTLMPMTIKAAAKQKLTEAIAVHKNLIHPEDRDFYRIDHVDEILAALDNHPASTVSESQIREQIASYDKWNEKKFSQLWPDLDRMIKTHD